MRKKDNATSLYNEGDFEREFGIAGDWKDDFDKFGRSPFWRDYARLVQAPAFRRLKGKTQLFPGYDSDFFRCRLTHSIEVGHIGKSIANYINRQLEDLYRKKRINQPDPFRSFINTDLIEFACYAHDIGHPPFGHQGEAELDLWMKKHGGFEGNAQTLRILSKIEKKYFKRFEEKDKNNTGFSPDGTDHRAGLSPTYRSLASVLKYDNEIKKVRGESEGLGKGYYYTEAELVNEIKEKVTGNRNCSAFRTIECSIMDIADDIAYSIYDLEDAFKAGFTHPYNLYSEDDEILQKVVDKVKAAGSKPGKEILLQCTIPDVRDVIVDQLKIKDISKAAIEKPYLLNSSSIKFAEHGFLRNQLTTEFVTDAIKNIYIDTSNPSPALWEVKFKDANMLLSIEILKRLTYQFQISSPKLKIIEYRGRKIIGDIFKVLVDEEAKGWEFLPPDFGYIYERASKNSDPSLKMRILCDFIAGMTDNYALEYRNRLYSSNFTSIHKRI